MSAAPLEHSLPAFPSSVLVDPGAALVHGWYAALVTPVQRRYAALPLDANFVRGAWAERERHCLFAGRMLYTDREYAFFVVPKHYTGRLNRMPSMSKPRSHTAHGNTYTSKHPPPATTNKNNGESVQYNEELTVFFDSKCVNKDDPIPASEECLHNLLSLFANPPMGCPSYISPVLISFSNIVPFL